MNQSGSGADLSGVDFEDLVAEMIRRLGDDPDREGLRKTPGRVVESMSFLTKGYGERPEDALGDALYEERHQSMVLVKDIELYSLCEHHLLPFFGKAHGTSHLLRIWTRPRPLTACVPRRPPVPAAPHAQD